MLDGLVEYGYWGLLLASFLAATVLPFSSEVVFAALIAAGLDIWQCSAKRNGCKNGSGLNLNRSIR